MIRRDKGVSCKWRLWYPKNRELIVIEGPICMQQNHPQFVLEYHPFFHRSTKSAPLFVKVEFYIRFWLIFVRILERWLLSVRPISRCQAARITSWSSEEESRIGDPKPDFSLAPNFYGRKYDVFLKRREEKKVSKSPSWNSWQHCTQTFMWYLWR